MAFITNIEIFLQCIVLDPCIVLVQSSVLVKQAKKNSFKMLSSICSPDFFCACAIFRTGSGRVFSGSGIWPKYGAGFGKMQNILTGFGI